MLSRRKTRHLASYIAIAAVVALIVPSAAWSQASPTNNADTTSTSAVVSNTQPSVEEAPIDNPVVPAYKEGSAIRAIGSAKPMNGPAGPLTWGWFSVGSAEASVGFDRTSFSALGPQPLAGGAGAPATIQTNILTLLSTTIAMTRESKNFNLAFQYAPVLYIVNGEPSNSGNQALGFNTSQRLNERWTLNIGDLLNYYRTNNAFAAFAFDVDYVTGGALQKTFLQGAGSLLFENADAEFTYLWSPRTTVAAGPVFSYQHSTGAFASGQGRSQTGVYSGGNFELKHLLSAEKAIAFSYTAKEAQFFANHVPNAANGNELLQDIMADYYQALGPTWHLTLGAGVATESGGGPGQLALGLTAGISKKFRRVEYAVGYERGHQYVGLITGQVTDRVDAIQRIYWTKRFSTATSASYFRTTGYPSESGFYGAGMVSFRLKPSVSILGHLSYVTQTGDGVIVPNGNRYYVASGIRWEAVPPAGQE